MVKNFEINIQFKPILKNNFILVLLEDLGPRASVTKDFMLNRELYYLDILFSNDSYLKLNNSPTAGNTLGFKHTTEFKLNRSGKLNPSACGMEILFQLNF